MEKLRINGMRMGHPADHLASDARELAQLWTDEGRAFVSRKAVPFMIGSLIAGFLLGLACRTRKSSRKVSRVASRA